MRGFADTLSSWWGAWQHAGRCGTGEKNWDTSCRQQEVICDTGQYPEHRNPQSPPPQCHTSSNKAIPIPTKPHLQIVPRPKRLWEPNTFKLPHWVGWQYFVHRPQYGWCLQYGMMNCLSRSSCLCLHHPAPSQTSILISFLVWDTTYIFPFFSLPFTGLSPHPLTQCNQQNSIRESLTLCIYCVFSVSGISWTLELY